MGALGDLEAKPPKLRANYKVKLVFSCSALTFEAFDPFSTIAWE
jgi:hypothetical protein